MAINLYQQRFLQPLRSNILGSKELAIEALQNVAAEIAKTDSISTKADGSQIIARYTDGDIVKSIFGIYEHSKKAITIYSYDDEALEKEIDALENAIEAAESAAKAAATKVVLDEDDETKAHLGIAEAEGADGNITYTLSAKDIASQTNLNSAVSRIEANESAIETLNGDESVEGSVAKEVKDGVDALRTELLGEVSDTDAKTFAELNDKIESVESAAKSYSIVEVTEGLGTNIEKAYQLQETVGENSVLVGSLIQLQKDDSLVSVALVDADGKEDEKGQYLQFIYNLSDGTEKTVKIDVTHFLAESEFKEGLQVSESGEVSVKIDGTSESFLSVSSEGVKLSGVQDAIEAAKTAIEGTLVDGDAKTLQEVNSELNGLDQAINALETDKNFVKAVNVNGVEATISENKATVTIDGSDVSLSTDYTNADYTNVASANLTAVNDGDSIDAAISTLEGNIVKLTKEVLDNETVCSNAITKLNEALGLSENAEFAVCEGAKHMAGASSVSEALCKLDIAIESIKNGATSELGDAIAALDVTDTAEEGKIVVSVSQTDGKVSNEKVSLENIVLSSESTEDVKVTLGDKIDSIEQTIADNKAACEAAAAAATSKVSLKDENSEEEGIQSILSLEEKDNEDGSKTYELGISDTWDCGTFEYTK